MAGLRGITQAREKVGKPSADRLLWKAEERQRLAAERDLIREAIAAARADAEALASIPTVRPERKTATREQRRKWQQTARAKEAADPERKAARRASERRRVKASPKAREAATASETARRTRLALGRPFIGVDGEGAGEDELGRQHYMLLRAGEMELWTGKPLGTLECLDFLCNTPPTKKALLVGFSFGYDVTMILRDLPSARRAHLLMDKDQGDGKSRYTYWSGDRQTSHGFGIEYLKNNYFRVCRTLLHRVPRIVPDGTGGEGRIEYQMIPRAIEGTSRTVYETFGFFQSSFLKTLNAWNIGTPAERAEIEVNKAERGAVAIDKRQRDYCALECRFLGELMEQFRSVCLDPAVNIRPRTWNGAGKLSSALHTTWGTMTAEDLGLRLAGLLPGRGADFLRAASAAYYGGRFEVTRTGAIAGPIWEYDIHSAYPAAMRGLPCLEHGTWEEVSPRALSDLDPACHTFVAPLRFDHSAKFAPRPNGGSGGRLNVCGLPVRQKSGRLFWPIQGGGIYWSCEIAGAKKLGCQVSYTGPGWIYNRQCDCQPFPHLEPLFQARRALGADLRGHPIKLAINGLYGKLAQRIGHPKFANLIWAGLITAITRAALMEAASHDPEAVIMFATDALFTTRPLFALDVGAGLGQWEGKEHGRLFIVQPGIYWGASRPKMRGVPDSVLTAHTGRFETAWSDYRDRDRAAHRGGEAAFPPVVAVPIRLFTGIRIAQHRGKPETAGVWTDTPRRFDFAWHAKRGRHVWQGDGTNDHVWTFPAAGGPDLWSRPHRSDAQLILQLDAEKEELQEQADAIDLSVPWSD